MNPEEARSVISAQGFLPYETLSADDSWHPLRQTAADEIIEHGWQNRHFPRIDLTPPVDWDNIAAADRSWSFHLHSWDFLGSVIATYAHTGEKRYLDWALSVAGDWARQHPVVAADRSMAWYDMAIGLRAYRIGYLLDTAARADQVSDLDFDLLLSCAALHLEALSGPDFFAAHSNHGFYVAAGQLALARRMRDLPGMDKHREQARERVNQLVRTQFTPAGVHREHSPGYHRMVLDTFQGLVEAGLLDSEEFGPLLDRIQEALAWFVLPNGRLAMFGDTNHKNVVRTGSARAVHPALEFTLDRGASGAPPEEHWRSFPDAGYFVARDRWPAGPEDFADCSYLAQTAGFHSRVHKHADDLSLVWYDHGHEILVDAGKFGYLDRTSPDSELGKAGFYYAHPSRVYVESTRAHNTVEIDHGSYRRRGIPPYGSGLLQAGEYRGVLYSGTHVRHNKSVRHARVLAFRPGAWLVVYDWLWENLDRSHTYTQRFHFAPELEVAAAGDGFEAALPGTRLHVVPLLPASPLAPVRGQQEPELLGWISRQDGELQPCWTSAFQVDGAATCSMATLFAFSDSPPVPGESTVSARGEKVGLRWAHRGQEWQLDFGRPDRDDFGFHAEHTPAPERVPTVRRMLGWLRGLTAT